MWKWTLKPLVNDGALTDPSLERRQAEAGSVEHAERRDLIEVRNTGCC